MAQSKTPSHNGLCQLSAHPLLQSAKAPDEQCALSFCARVWNILPLPPRRPCKLSCFTHVLKTSSSEYGFYGASSHREGKCSLATCIPMAQQGQVAMSKGRIPEVKRAQQGRVQTWRLYFGSFPHLQSVTSLHLPWVLWWLKMAQRKP